MQLNTMDEKTLRGYLLGDLSADQQEKFEQWLLCNDDAYDLLVAAEDDLIDESLNGNLKGHELERLNNYFLATSERQRKLQFGRSLRQYIHNAHSPQPKVSLWEAIAGLFRERATLAWSMSTLVALLAVGNVWFMHRATNLQTQLANAGQKQEELGQQLSERQNHLQTLVQALATSPNSVSLMAVTLTPLTLRSASDLKTIQIVPGTVVVNFSLELLENGHFDEYRAVLLGRNDQEVWTFDHLRTKAAPDSKAVILSVPVDANDLKPGDYSLKLSGVANAGLEDVGSYKFRVSP